MVAHLKKTKTKTKLKSKTRVHNCTSSASSKAQFLVFFTASAIQWFQYNRHFWMDRSGSRASLTVNFFSWGTKQNSDWEQSNGQGQHCVRWFLDCFDDGFQWSSTIGQAWEWLHTNYSDLTSTCTAAMAYWSLLSTIYSDQFLYFEYFEYCINTIWSQYSVHCAQKV